MRTGKHTLAMMGQAYLERLQGVQVQTTGSDVMRDREAVEEGGLKAFVELAWPLIDPAPFRDNWHIDAVCDHLEAVASGDILRLIINVPPGTSKTSIASVLFPTYTWILDPAWAWITASYSPKLSTRDARRMRGLTHSAWFNDRWPRASVEDLQRIVNFSNRSGGWRLSTTPGSDATGFHADAHLVDDPIKPRDAREARTTDTRAKLEEIIEWWKHTMSTRAKNQEMLRRVIIMQRIHDRDLSGAMLEEGGYEHLCLPMEYNPKIFCETSLGRPDPRREAGELLDPVRYPRAVVDRLRTELADAAAAQLDQSPVTPGGGLFKDTYFAKRWALASLPRDLVMIQSWDLRFKDDAEKGSYVVGQVWGYRPGRPDTYLLHQVRGRWSYAETKDEFRKLCDAWPRSIVQLVENKANGPALKSDLEGDGYNIELVDVMGSKVLRANVAEPFWRSGQVWIPDTEWTDEFVKEHTRFPRYRTDDQVDAASQAIAWIHVQGSQLGEYLAGVIAASTGR